MNLRSQLPKLGKDYSKNGVNFVALIAEGVPHGVDITLGRYHARPNYTTLKREYNTENDCVSILVGMMSPSDIIFPFEIMRKDDWGNYMDSENESDRQLIILSGPLVALFKEIREYIDLGLRRKEIKSDGERLSDDMDGFFSFSMWLNTLDFLYWMQRNGYPIPDELAIEKNSQGELVWADQTREDNKAATVSTPPGTTWHQIHFRIVNPNRIEITTPDGMAPYHPDDLGFTPKVWDLFEQFAAEGAEYIKEGKADISRLRRLLKKIFLGVEGDPIPLDKNKGYKAEFHVIEA
ncbi:MAG: hypothetical protein K9K21_01400 [Desulfotignum sp.]|nr:hypothetical protein [Desulfotignum sp.]MCF8125283.1 hypothetical protein [Desulfotignum sp.]